jgi:hypothetical protein
MRADIVFLVCRLEGALRLYLSGWREVDKFTQARMKAAQTKEFSRGYSDLTTIRLRLNARTPAFISRIARQQLGDHIARRVAIE